MKNKFLRIVILGSGGQLGRELEEHLGSIGSVHSFSRAELDIQNHKAVEDAIDKVQPDIILNAAAYTAVDKAEIEREIAFEINSNAVENLAVISKKMNIWLIHFSTDYVFDGQKNSPYCENDHPNPINVYGLSKLAGELAISKTKCKHLIFRTTWVIGENGNNFAKTILSLAKEREYISVIGDQIGVPTATSLICSVTLDAINAIQKNASWPSGIYHLAPQGVSSWYEIAVTLLEQAERKNIHFRLKKENITSITTAEYPTKARRPLNSLLDTRKLKRELSFELPQWESGLIKVANSIIKEVI